MFTFKLNIDEWNEKELKEFRIKKNAKFFHHLPTGLFVAGFLANVGLFKIDQAAEQEFENPDRKIAHFRYVDDHIFIAYSFEELISWVNFYLGLLDSFDIGVKCNIEKTEPKELGFYLSAAKQKKSQSSINNFYKQAQESTYLDPRFPSPLMTKTLALVSSIARSNFDLMELSEIAALNDQLEHLLIVDIPEKEIPIKTRVSFAAGKLTKIMECRLSNPEELTHKQVQREHLYCLKLKENIKDLNIKNDLEKSIESLDKEIEKASDIIEEEKSRTFQLLNKVLNDNPDRVRLWIKTIRYCRVSGIKKISEIINNINTMLVNDSVAVKLTGKYFFANLLAILGNERWRTIKFAI